MQTQHYRPISGKSRTAEGKRSASSSPLFSTAGRRHAEEERFPRTQWEPRTRRRGERRASDRQQGVSEFTVCMGENLSWNFFITSWSLWKKMLHQHHPHLRFTPNFTKTNSESQNLRKTRQTVLNYPPTVRGEAEVCVYEFLCVTKSWLLPAQLHARVCFVSLNIYSAKLSQLARKKAFWIPFLFRKLIPSKRIHDSCVHC